MFAETVACELQKQVGVEKAFSIKSVKHLYDKRVEVEYVLLEEIGSDKGATVYNKRIDISSTLLLSEYKEICESLTEKAESLNVENLDLMEENDRLFKSLQREKSKHSDDPLLEGTI